MSKPELLVLVAGGDGDGFSIGGGHIPHAVRRNLDLTYLVMDNHIYGLTKGQASPTTAKGTTTPSTVYGRWRIPSIRSLMSSPTARGSWPRGCPSDIDGLTKIIAEAIRYPGFSFVNIQSPCVTFGEVQNQLKAMKARARSLSAEGHDPSNRLRAMASPRTTERPSTPASSTGIQSAADLRQPDPGPAAVARDRVGRVPGRHLA